MRKNIIYELAINKDIKEELENTQELKASEKRLEKILDELLEKNYEGYFALDEAIGELIITHQSIYYRFGLKVGIDIAREVLERESEVI